jgi:ABC-type enterochelin transport system permease subunit
MGIINTLREFKIGQFAIFDSVLAYVGIFLLAPLLTKIFYKFHLNITRSAWLWLTLPIAVIFHLVFRQNTPFMKMFLGPNGYLVAKVILLSMLFMGVRNIKVLKQTNDSSKI